MFEKFAVFKNMDNDEESIVNEFNNEIRKIGPEIKSDTEGETKSQMTVEKFKSILERDYTLIDNTNFENIFLFLCKYDYNDFNEFVDNFIEYTNQKNLKFDTSCFNDNFTLNQIFSLSCVNNENKCKLCHKAMANGHPYCMRDIMLGMSWDREFGTKPGTFRVILKRFPFLVEKVLKHILTTGKSEEVTEYVIRNYVENPNIQIYCDSLLHHMIKRGFINSVKILLEKKVYTRCLVLSGGYFQSSLMASIEFDQLEIFKLFTELKFDFLKDESGTPMTNAINYESLKILKYLLDQEKNINSDKIRKNFIHAVVRCKEKAMQVFIDRGFDINFSVNRKIPIFTALDYYKLNAVQMLVDKGADLKMKNSLGQTVLEVAKSYLEDPGRNQVCKPDPWGFYKAERESIVRKIIDLVESKI